MNRQDSIIATAIAVRQHLDGCKRGTYPKGGRCVPARRKMTGADKAIVAANLAASGVGLTYAGIHLHKAIKNAVASHKRSQNLRKQHEEFKKQSEAFRGNLQKEAEERSQRATQQNEIKARTAVEDVDEKIRRRSTRRGQDDAPAAKRTIDVTARTVEDALSASIAINQRLDWCGKGMVGNGNGQCSPARGRRLKTAAGILGAGALVAGGVALMKKNQQKQGASPAPAENTPPSSPSTPPKKEQGIPPQKEPETTGSEDLDLPGWKPDKKFANSRKVAERRKKLPNPDPRDMEDRKRKLGLDVTGDKQIMGRQNARAAQGFKHTSYFDSEIIATAIAVRQHLDGCKPGSRPVKGRGCVMTHGQRMSNFRQATGNALHGAASTLNRSADVIQKTATTAIALKTLHELSKMNQQQKAKP